MPARIQVLRSVLLLNNFSSIILYSTPEAKRQIIRRQKNIIKSLKSRLSKQVLQKAKHDINLLKKMLHKLNPGPLLSALILDQVSEIDEKYLKKKFTTRSVIVQQRSLMARYSRDFR